MKKYILIVMLAMVSVSGNAQVTFNKYVDLLYNNSINNNYISFATQTSDGGYIATGKTGGDTISNSNIILLRTDINGDTLWVKSIKGLNDDIGTYVAQTNDGGYILTAITNSVGAGDVDGYLLKTDSIGTPLWSKTYGGVNHDELQMIHQTIDGGYIMCGGTDSYGSGGYDGYLIKTDANGDTLWTRTYGNNLYETINSVEQTTDGGYILCGTAYLDSLNSAVYLVKTNSVGDTLWTRVIQDYDSNEGYNAIQNQEGGYVIAASTWDIVTTTILIKTDSSGIPLWSRHFFCDTPVFGTSMFNSYVHLTNDGNYIYAANGEDTGSESHFCLIKTDTDGNTIWSNVYDDMYDGIEFSSLQTTSDGGFIISNNYTFITKTDSLGFQNCIFIEPTNGFDTITPIHVVNAITQVSSGAIVSNSTMPIINSGNNYHDSCSVFIINVSQIPNSNSEITLFPNPTSSTFTITTTGTQLKEIKIMNVLGEEMKKQLIMDNGQWTMDVGDLAKGIYFVEITTDKGKENRKLIIQ